MKPSVFEQLKAIALLPFMVIIIIPVVLLLVFGPIRLFSNEFIRSPVLIIAGGIILLAGLMLFIQSVRLFIRIGNGTLAPWNPTKKLVVRSMYRYVRNPMILGVFLILISESLLFNNFQILCWAFIFIAINHLYFILKEEPDLQNRFGEEYEIYKRNVPRWIPRLTPWKPENL